MNETKLPVRARKSPCGVAVEQGKNYFWCASGLSKKQPFRDGMHSSL